MPDESLEKVRYTLLGIIVPNLEQVVLSSGKHIATVKGKISASDSAFMYST